MKQGGGRHPVCMYVREGGGKRDRVCVGGGGGGGIRPGDKNEVCEDPKTEPLSTLILQIT